ncbi:MAG: ABC transporter ATP-binding protein [Anaerofustis stercorihominis]|nr:ABC transporter ATP-binding protein [Anaerofustis stercorihominis]
MMNYITIKNLEKTYNSGENSTHALKGINITVPEGKLTIITGDSGAGKSTTLNIIGAMDNADSGSCIVGGKELVGLSEKELRKYRKDIVGFVFQFYSLSPNLTALENVQLSAELSENPLDAKEVLRLVGLGDRMKNFPSQLSGGEQQRVAIARALVKNPKLLLCDEPTGALDYETGKEILSLIKKSCEDMNMTVVIVSHNSQITPIADKVIILRSGEVDSEYINEHPMDVKDVEW